MALKDGAFIVDRSHWEPYADPKKLTGLHALISRIGTQLINVDPKGWMDLTFPPGCQVAWDIQNEDGTFGIPHGGYFYDDWTYWPVMQYTYGAVQNFTVDTDPRIITCRRAFFSGTARRFFDFLVVDVEQIPEKPLNLADNWANWISTSCRSLVDCWLHMMNSGEIPQMPIGVYARKSYIDQYCLLLDGSCPLTDWMSQYQKNLGPGRWLDWVADWRYSRAVNGKIYTPITAKNETIPLDIHKPASLSDWPDVIWQYGAEGEHEVTMAGFTDDRNIPMVVDVNITQIPKEDFYKLVNFTPRGDPQPPKPPTLTYYATVRQTATGLKLRNAPNTSALVLDEDFRPAGEFEIVGEPVVDGLITWASLGLAYFATEQITTAGIKRVYADIVSR